jgi:hypothetical protein
VQFCVVVASGEQLRCGDPGSLRWLGLMMNSLPTIVLAVLVLLCTLTLYGCYRAFDRLLTRIEGARGGRRWLLIGVAGGVGMIALCTFWACFALSAGLMQTLGLNLR